jgi:pimeloyl-ACP methyl ester carboxylesterase
VCFAEASNNSNEDNDNHHLNLESKTWMFRNIHPIYYEIATYNRSNEYDPSTTSTATIVPIFLLNGFGVGTYHQHRLMRQLLLESRRSRSCGEQERSRYIIYGIDYLGQGNSWPTNCDDDGLSINECGLGYSADTWLEQLEGFIQEIVVPTCGSEDNEEHKDLVDRRVHLVGNSVGGYLATMIAHRHPHLISSLTLLNATPVWGLNLPGWDGKLPPPPLPRLLGRTLFDSIRNEDIIDKYLQVAYVNREAFDGTFHDGFHEKDEMRRPLGKMIRASTEVKGGHAAFASILWSAPASEQRQETHDNDSPATSVNFYRTLGEIEVDVLLLFGAEDPWCTPAIAKRMHTALASSSSSLDRLPARRYISLENVGHCPNHEAPTALAKVLIPWLGATTTSYSSTDGNHDDKDPKSVTRRSDVPLLSGERIREPWGVVGIREIPIEESQNLNVLDRIVSSIAG